MQPSDLRIALFVGNYNYVRDGASQTLNRLVKYLLEQGVTVRIYSPTVDEPAFEPTGQIVSVPSLPIPFRPEYRFPLGLPLRVRRDVRRFAPNIVHIASPDIASHRALSWARAREIPTVASVHTRFETYCRYYGLSVLEPLATALLRRFYRRCDAIFAPSDSMAQELRRQRMNYDIGIWSRGIDHGIFNPGRRDMEWRRSLGIPDKTPVIGFVGRVVMEKGLDVFAESIDRLAKRHVDHRVLVVGAGPAKDWFEQRIPNAIFAGFLTHEELGRAIASMDLLFNPSDTETFGNVTLEAMAVGIPVVAACATGSQSLIDDGVNGRLVRAGACDRFADALAQYCEKAAVRRSAGEAAQRFSLGFGWDDVNRDMLENYLRVIRQTKKARQAPPTIP
ncbi:MAG: glycosyltransferase family 1 protein [Sphingomonas sp.]|nr:glycosyltransferase family 1 protein [Sphingomonas sp.]